MVAVAQSTQTTKLRITSNTGARVKRVHHGGRDYLVAPASLIVPGVLNGSDGAGYYPLDECVKNVKAWDDMPIVVYHPTKNGVPVAASDPDHADDVLRESGIGFLRNTRDVGKLASEAWFDEEYVQDYDKKLQPQFRIYPRLLRNESIELSTGLVVHKDYTPGSCPKTGRAYDWVARNHQPDHLAVLPDQRGACSVEDGCGITVNEPSDKLDVAPEKACQILKDGEANGHELTEAQRGMFGAKCGETRNEETDVTDNADDGQWVTLPNGVHIQIKDGEIVKGPKIGEGEKKDVGVSKKAQSLTEKATKSASAADHKAAAEAHRDAAKHYLAKGDTAKASAHSGMAVKHAQEYATKHTKNEDATSLREETDMAVAMTPEIRQGLVGKLVANCKCEGASPDAEVLNKLSDSTLVRLVENGMPEALAKAKAKKEDAMDGGADDEEENADGTKKTTKNQRRDSQMVNNAQVGSPISAKEWLEQAPPEIRSIVVNAMESEREIKQDCINRLVGNVADADKPAYTALYNGMETKALKMLVKALPPTQNASDIDHLFAPVTYQGSVGGPEGGNRQTNNAEFDAPEGIPVVNWEEEQVKEERLTRQRREVSAA